MVPGLATLGTALSSVSLVSITDDQASRAGWGTPGVLLLLNSRNAESTGRRSLVQGHSLGGKFPAPCGNLLPASLFEVLPVLECGFVCPQLQPLFRSERNPAAVLWTSNLFLHFPEKPPPDRNWSRTWNSRARDIYYRVNSSENHKVSPVRLRWWK